MGAAADITCYSFYANKTITTGEGGMACTANDAYCSLTDGRSCHCTNCVDGPVVRCTMEYLWRCEALSTTMGCP